MTEQSGTTITGSTGSHSADESTDRHVVMVDDIGAVEIPGKHPCHRIIVNGVQYVHVTTDAAGRWGYRKY